MFGRKGLKPGQSATASQASGAPSSPPVANGNGVPQPVFAAASYVACISPGGPPVFIEELASLTPCAGPNGALGLCFLFSASGDADRGKAYFFPDFASIWVDGEAGPRAQIPTAMIAERVPGYLPTLQAFISGLESRISEVRKAMVS